MVLALQWYCGDNGKYGLISKHLFQRKLQYGGWKNLKVTTKFYKKQWLRVIKGDKYHSSKQVVSIICTLDETFFAANIFEDLSVVSFEIEEKTLKHTLVCISFLCISREDTNKQVIM